MFLAPPRTHRYTPAMAPGVDLIVGVMVVALPLLAAIVLHEVAHGAVAYACGDPTAALRGRLTLNPLRHLDPVGSLLVPGLLLLAPYVFGGRPLVFGWARPVPVDVRRLRNPGRDAVLVALAGPWTNLLLAAASTAALAAAGPEGLLGEILLVSLWINCVIAVFNLLPVPPLDGAQVLAACLPRRAAAAFARVQGLGFVVLVLVLMNTNLIAQLTQPLARLFLSFVPLPP